MQRRRAKGEWTINIFVRIDPDDGRPIYLQIVHQIKYLLASGALAPGDKLPSVRELATQPRVNPLTIVKAYDRLERDGVIVTRRGIGTYIADSIEHPELTKRHTREIVARHLDRALVEAQQLGLTFEEVEALLRDRYVRLQRMQNER